jgi:hypothetical protein
MTQAKTGRGPIKVRVICKSAVGAKKQSSPITLSLVDKKAEEYSTNRLTAKNKVHQEK